MLTKHFYYLRGIQDWKMFAGFSSPISSHYIQCAVHKLIKLHFKNKRMMRCLCLYYWETFLELQCCEF